MTVSKQNQRLAVVGAGLIGQRHAAHVTDQAILHAIVDPAPAARDIADRYGVARYSNLQAMLDESPPDGIILATPTPLHFEQAMCCVNAGIAALIEKPVTSDTTDGKELVTAADRAGVPLLVGHHRRHNPIIQAARQVIESGRLGTIISTQATCWLFKPDPYFDVTWRREKGAGPILTNLIHDVDLLRYLCGDISFVQAAQSSRQRGFDNEDTAAVVIGFANGALGTISLSDTIVAPWSWELTAGENRAYPHTSEAAYLIGGTRGALSLPNLSIWHNGDTPGWWEPIHRETMPTDAADPLARQIIHFCDVITGKAKPLVSAAEGLKTLEVINAIQASASTCQRVELNPLAE